MIKTIALVAGLAIVPLAAIAQSTQAPVNSPSNNRPSASAPTPSPNGASMPATPTPGITQNPAGGGVMGAPANAPASPGGTMPARPAPSGTPDPAGSGVSGSKP